MPVLLTVAELEPVFCRQCLEKRRIEKIFALRRQTKA